jgi:gliding motility-associated-like protein
MLQKSLFLFLTILPFFTHAQPAVCEGNLGENIFEEGDFGSGSAVFLAQDPGIAPGYRYVLTPPPNDGGYSITNNTGRWANNYGTWLHISDNSSDPDGYMMVVNADYTPGLFYDQNIEGLCENTLYEFSADVINMIMTEVTDHIKPNVSFLIDDEEAFTTGEIPQDERWHTYGFSFTTAPGQTGVRLSLRNNAPGGIGNDLALDNISFRPCGPEALILPAEVANICEDGDPIDLAATVYGDQFDTPAFQWQQSFDEGQTWSDIPGTNTPAYTHDELSSGFYYYRYLLANGDVNLQNPKCRVISNRKIVHVVPKFYTVADTICEGLTYSQNGKQYNTSGVYVDSLLSSIGCDSIVTLKLTVLPDAGIEAGVRIDDPSCYDSSDGQVTVEHVVNGSPPYTYTLTGRPPNGSGDFPALPAGSYELSVTDRYGCAFREPLTIEAPPEFTVDLGPDLEVTLGDQVLLHVVANRPVESFSWEPAGLFDCPAGCQGAVWVPIRSTTLTLSAVSDRGCAAEDALRVAVDLDRRIFFPNAFSPDGNGVNDVFMIFGDAPNVQQIRRFAVFDRWGNLLVEHRNFQPNDPKSGWDGKFKGQLLPQGVYVYMADIEFLDGKVLTFSGDVMLVR